MHAPLPETMMEESPYLHEPLSEPIPGYRLIEPLGRGGFGEVWKCEAPGGLLKAIKIVGGALHALDDTAPADEELRAIQRVKTMRHPFILMMERVEVVRGSLVIVMELADRSLGDVLRDERLAGNRGIARGTLLNYMREAAEVLDVMNTRFELQHLDVKPQNLFLVSNHVKVGDFGLVNNLGGANKGVALGAITPLYASPEVFNGKISPHSDQYSLAIVYMELLTGTLPFNGNNSRKLLMQHMQEQPDLSALPETDRLVVARALSKNPVDRYGSCGDFVQALASGDADVISRTTVARDLPARVAQQDTKATPSAKTAKVRMPAFRATSAPTGEGMYGLTMLDMVSRTPSGEVWNARTESGEARLVKVFFSGAGSASDGLKRLEELRHPSLMPTDVLQNQPGRIVLSSPPGDRSLRDVLGETASQGKPGVPRPTLLAMLRSVAEGLEYLAAHYALYHWGLNPRTLVLDGGRVRMLDFAQAQLLHMAVGRSAASMNPRYSAPEVTAGRPAESSDQYSLALIFHEMLTGAFPATMPAARGQTPVVNVDRLPPADRLTVARALNADPRRRYDSAVAFIDALSDDSDAVDLGGPAVPASPRAGLPTAIARPGSLTDHEIAVRPSAQGIVPTQGAPSGRMAPAAEEPGEIMKTRFGTHLAPDVLRQRLEGFRNQWNATSVSADARHVVLTMQTPRNFWQRWTGRQPLLEIRLDILPPDLTAPSGVQIRTELEMQMRPKDCNREQSAELVKVVGPLLIESLRSHLQVNPRGRSQERVTWHHTLHLCSVGPDGRAGAAVECQGKDISLNGIGFYLPGQLPASDVLLHLPQTEQTPKMTIPARIVRVQGCGDGWYECGAVLLPPDELPPDEDE